MKPKEPVGTWSRPILALRVKPESDMASIGLTEPSTTMYADLQIERRLSDDISANPLICL